MPFKYTDAFVFSSSVQYWIRLLAHVALAAVGDGVWSEIGDGCSKRLLFLHFLPALPYYICLQL